MIEQSNEAVLGVNYYLGRIERNFEEDIRRTDPHNLTGLSESEDSFRIKGRIRCRNDFFVNV